MLLRLANLFASTASALLSVGAVVLYIFHVQYAMAHNNAANFRPKFIALVLIIVLCSVAGSAFGVRQLIAGSNETERALAILPLTFHVLMVFILLLVACGFDVVAP